MEKNAIRDSLTERLDVADLKYDIRRLSAELYRHKSRTVIFEETINERKAELDKVLDTKPQHHSEEVIYQ